MFSRLLPQEGRFFEHFKELAELIVQASGELQALMGSFDDVERRRFNIETIEKKGDRVTHATVELLHKSFITPLDRDDMHRLVTKMDDILDLIEDSAQSISMYDVRAVTADAARLAELCVACAERVRAAVELLPDMENARRIIEVCTDIDRLESEADHLMRAAMARLFREEPDVRQLIKLRTVYELLEEMTDRCEDVANIIEGIVVENA
jgi:predicted phosphate transport protein (TIGR00153 family)